jgi:hypothetical protein
MKSVVQIEHRASSSRGKHEGESSFGLCDRLSRTRDNSQRQLPTDQDYAVPTREYQTDQSSLKTAPTAARSVLEKRRKQPQQQTHRLRRLTRSLHIRPMHSLKGGRVDICIRKNKSRHSISLFSSQTNPSRFASGCSKSGSVVSVVAGFAGTGAAGSLGGNAAGIVGSGLATG